MNRGAGIAQVDYVRVPCARRDEPAALAEFALDLQCSLRSQG